MPEIVAAFQAVDDHPFPLPFRDVTGQPLATRAAPPEMSHIGGDGSPIEKRQSRGIKKPLLPNPAPPRASYVRSLLLGSLF